MSRVSVSGYWLFRPIPILLLGVLLCGCMTTPRDGSAPVTPMPAIHAAEKSVLAINRAFYKALHERNFDAMKKLWAHSGPVAVVHSGWPELLGREAVLRSWKALLADKSQVFADCRGAQVELQGQKAAVVCDLQGESNVVRSINVFRRHGEGWEMIFHGVRTLPSMRA